MKRKISNSNSNPISEGPLALSSRSPNPLRHVDYRQLNEASLAAHERLALPPTFCTTFWARGRGLLGFDLG